MRHRRATSENQRLVWVPGTGPDPEALARLTRRGPRPSTPLQKAWFFGEPTYHPELLKHDPQELCPNDLGGYLLEIASAASCMGLRGEWLAWLHYLLPRLVPYALEYSDRDPERRQLIVRYPFGKLVSAFMAMYPSNDIDDREFTDDVVGTLGRALMKPSLWSGEGRSAALVHEEGECCIRTADLYAAMFLHLKYLRVDDVNPWAQSLLAISDPTWRAMLLEWMLGSARYLRGEATFVWQLSKKRAWDLHPWWQGSESIGCEETLTSEANRIEFCQSLGENLTEPLLLEWFDSFATVDGLEEKLTDWPERFVGEFFPKNASKFTV